MADVVLIHGIDQQQKSADLLEKDWLPALAGGVRTAGFPDIADCIWRAQRGLGVIEARMAFYGHLFLVPGQQGDAPVALTTNQQAFARNLALEWIGRAATRASNPREKSTAQRELGAVRGELGVEQGMGELYRNIINRLTQIRWFAFMGMGFAEQFVKRALAQVTLYLTDDRIRTDTLAIVHQLIDSNTKVVIGHSLGSIVAYEAVQQLEHPLPLLVTVGSPLGLDTIVYPRLQPQPPCFPPYVKRWVNVADRDDFIAAEPNLTNLFKAGIPADAVFEGEYTVDNGSDPHNSDFYLSKIEVGRPVGQVLNIRSELA
jgi:hypothetical protein